MARGAYNPRYRAYKPLPVAAQVAQGIASSVNRFLEQRRQNILDKREEERKRAQDIYWELVHNPGAWTEEDAKIISRQAHMPEPQVKKIQKEALKAKERERAYKEEMARARFLQSVQQEARLRKTAEVTRQVALGNLKINQDREARLKKAVDTGEMTIEDYRKRKADLIKQFLPEKQKDQPIGYNQQGLPILGTPGYTTAEYKQASRKADKVIVQELERFGQQIPEWAKQAKNPAAKEPKQKPGKEKSGADPVQEILNLLP